MTPNGPRSETYGRRRTAAAERMADGEILFVVGPPESVYSRDVHYRYRPDSNIRYLTGFEEPSALMLMASGEFTLFVEARDREAERWTGPRPGPAGAREVYGADRGMELAQWPQQLSAALKDATRLYYGKARDRGDHEKVEAALESAAKDRHNGPVDVSDANELLGEMRLFKDEEEVELMRRACDISVSAHLSVIKGLRPGMHEYQIEALVDWELRRLGCAGPAYGTIAAGGANAAVLHYTRNDGLLAKGQLLLVDGGGEWGGYAADLTRTLPVAAAFSPPQADLYDLVLKAQAAALELMVPGSSYGEIHQASIKTMTAGMIELGMLEGPLEARLEDKTYSRYFMHRTSHWLGMDVHDLGSYGEEGAWRRLEAGMVMTVEPGIYVAADADVAPGMRGTGIRIEDDVLITAAGHEVLSCGLPKERAAIEALRTEALAQG